MWRSAFGRDTKNPTKTQLNSWTNTQCRNRILIHILSERLWAWCVVLDGLTCIKLRLSHDYANSNKASTPSTCHALCIMHHATRSAALHKKWMGSVDWTSVNRSCVSVLLKRHRTKQAHGWPVLNSKAWRSNVPFVRLQDDCGKWPSMSSLRTHRL